MRAHPPALDLYPFQTSHDLRYVDMDANSHVNNGAFGALMETNRAQMFIQIRDKAQTAEERLRTATVIARFEIDYLRELHWPATVISASGITRIGGASFQMRQALFSAAGCAAVALATCVILDTTTRRAAPLTAAMRAELQRWAMLTG